MNTLSRRSLIGAGVSALTVIKPQLVRGAGKELKAGLVGCGGRGTGAVENLLTGTENVDLVAMADIFEDKLEGSLQRLRDKNPQLAGRLKVDPEHHFVGFDAYRKLIASDVDIVMLCTPPGYRPEHFEAAVAAPFRRCFGFTTTTSEVKTGRSSLAFL